MSPSFPFHPGHDDPFQNQALQEMAGEMEYVVTVLEPRARQMNRRFTDVFGSHPSSPDGAWVYIEHREDGTYALAFESIAVDHAFRLEEHFDAITDLVDEAGLHPCFSRMPGIDPGALIVGDAAQLRAIPSIHVRIERRV